MSQDIDILTLGLAEAWHMYKVLIETHDTTYKQIRFGITIPFDINDYLKSRILTKPKTGLALIRGMTFKLTDFETELEQRERLIKAWLVKNYKEDELFSPRGEN